MARGGASSLRLQRVRGNPVGGWLGPTAGPAAQGDGHTPPGAGGPAAGRRIMAAAGPPAAAAGERGVVMEAVRQAERARREVEGLVGRLAEAQVEAQKVRAARDETAGRARVERAKL